MAFSLNKLGNTMPASGQSEVPQSTWEGGRPLSTLGTNCTEKRGTLLLRLRWIPAAVESRSSSIVYPLISRRIRVCQHMFLSNLSIKQCCFLRWVRRRGETVDKIVREKERTYKTLPFDLPRVTSLTWCPITMGTVSVQTPLSCLHFCRLKNRKTEISHGPTYSEPFLWH